MAFCPHCGKQVGEQAIKCIACGKEIEPKSKGARFKGTMMMSPGAGAAPAAPAPAPDPPNPAEAPKPAAAPAPQPMPRAPSSKVMKATMLGTGGPGLAPPPGLRPTPQAPVAPAAAAPAAAAPAP